jgi:16S rRNA (guanine527-N7)-methyltransferase
LPPAETLPAILAEAQRLGWIGRGPLEDQLRHAGAFSQLLGGGPGAVFDLGSGGGLPALPCALALPASRWVLVESQQRRADHLRSAVRRLELADRVEVVHGRAEDIARVRRGTSDVVTARSFGPPSVVAECAAPLLRVGGRLLVSEPPDAPARWPEEGLARFGLGPAEDREADGFRFVELAQFSVCPAEFPRRPGTPERKPLF